MMQGARADLVKKIGSVYKLVTLASRRAVELAGGAQKLVDAPVGEKPINIALQEILEDRVVLKKKKEEKG